MKTLFPTFSLVLLVCALPLAAQGGEERPSVPKGFLLPWHYVDIVPEIARSSSDILATERKRLAEQFFNNPQPLENSAKVKGSPRFLPNQAAWAREIIVTDDLKVGAQALMLEPVLCSLGDQFLVFLNALDPEKQHLLWTSHQSFARPSLREGISLALAGLSSEATEALSRPVAVSPSALQIDLRPRFLQTRKDQGSSFCIALLLAQQLLQEGFTVLPPLGREVPMALHDMFYRDLKMFRTTRHLLVGWNLPFQTPTFPLKGDFNLRMADAVFAKYAEGLTPSPWTIEREGKRLRIAWQEGFLKLLKNEAESLRRSEFPSVVKIYGAWAYLDRGRAWGLKINDRLVAEGLGSEIKGHIIGFYGPEQNLRNGLGNPIHEGAILFVRKGQDNVSMGQRFIFDPTKFPTDFPEP